jgi:hypothetical protein
MNKICPTVQASLRCTYIQTDKEVFQKLLLEIMGAKNE